MEQIKNRLITIDTMCIISFLDRDDPNHKRITKILNQARRISVSILAHLETAIGFYRDKDMNSLKILTNLPKIIPAFSFIPVNIEISAKSAQLRAKYGFLKTPDSIHLATALESHSECFVTEDKSLKKITELPVLHLGEIK